MKMRISESHTIVPVKETILSLALILMTSTLIAQVPDSLLNKFNSTSPDSSKINLIIQKSNEFASKDFNISLALAQMAFEQAQDHGLAQQEAFALKAIALAYSYNQNSVKAVEYYLKASEIFGLTGQRINVADMYLNIGVEYYFTENYDSSMQSYLKALPVYKELEATKSLGKVYNNMATNYRSLGMSDKAIEHFRKSNEYRLLISDSIGMMNTNLNIANLHRLEDQIDSALHYSRNAMNIAELIDDRFTQGLIHQVICLSYADLGNYELAKIEGLKSERLLREFNDVRNLARISASLATVYFRLDNCDSAKYYVNLFNELNQGLKMYRERREISRILASCAIKSGDFEEGYYQRSEELLLDDSVDAVEQQERLAAITAKYEESVRTTELLEKENQLAVAESSKNRLFAFASASIAALALALTLLVIIIQRNRKRKAKQEEKIRIQVNEIEKLRNKLAIQGELEPQLESKTPISLEEVNTHLINPLTERELEVLKAIAEGKSNQQIADELFVSINTIKSHVNKIYDKLDVNNRTQATLKASELKLVN